jgi:hypothetical protein
MYMRLIPPTARNRIQLAFFCCVVLLQPCVGKAELPTGSWKFSGTVNDDLHGANGSVVMHQTLAVSGYFENGSFILTVDPKKSLQNIWESAGWDGKLLRIVQNFPDKPGPAQPRNQWVGIVEPNVFSRHASIATTSVLMAFANSNILASIRQGGELIILGELRLYPEEDNTYEINQLPSGGLEIRAICPGQKVARGGNIPLTGFEHGFNRWTYHSTVDRPDSTNSMDSYKLKTEFEQFRPVGGRLLREHHIIGNLEFEKCDSKVTNFRPEINLDALSVRDYSGRPVIFPQNKGAVDQFYPYTLTNHLWNFDQQKIISNAMDYKEFVLKGGLTPAGLDIIDFNNPDPGTHPKRDRVGVLAGLGIISALFACILIRNWQASRNSQNQK